MGSLQSSPQNRVFPESIEFSDEDEAELVSEALRKLENGQELTELEKRLLMIDAIRRYVNSREQPLT